MMSLMSLMSLLLNDVFYVRLWTLMPLLQRDPLTETVDWRLFKVCRVFRWFVCACGRWYVSPPARPFSRDRRLANFFCLKCVSCVQMVHLRLWTLASLLQCRPFGRDRRLANVCGLGWFGLVNIGELVTARPGCAFGFTPQEYLNEDAKKAREVACRLTRGCMRLRMVMHAAPSWRRPS